MNNPGQWEVRGEPATFVTVEGRAQVIEAYAQADTPQLLGQLPALRFTGGGPGSQPRSLLAVASPHGNPLCAWCLAAGNW